MNLLGLEANEAVSQTCLSPYRLPKGPCHPEHGWPTVGAWESFSGWHKVWKTDLEATMMVGSQQRGR